MKPTPTFVGKKTRRAAPQEEKTRSLSRSQTPTTALSSSEETARASASPRASASTPTTPQLAREAMASGPERFTLPQPTSPHHRTGSWSLSASREPRAEGTGKPCTDTAAPTPRTSPLSAQQLLFGGDSPPIRQTGEGSGVSFQVLRCDELPQWKHPIVQLALQWLEGAQTMEAVRLAHPERGDKAQAIERQFELLGALVEALPRERRQAFLEQLDGAYAQHIDEALVACLEHPQREAPVTALAMRGAIRVLSAALRDGPTGPAPRQDNSTTGKAVRFFADWFAALRQPGTADLSGIKLLHQAQLFQVRMDPLTRDLTALMNGLFKLHELSP